MALANFPILSPQQANPLYNALQNMHQMQNVRQSALQTQFMKPLLQQKLAQQKIYTSEYPDILRASASKISPVGALVQGLTDYLNKKEAARNAPGIISRAGSDVGSFFHWLGSPSNQQNNSGSVRSSKEASQVPDEKVITKYPLRRLADGRMAYVAPDGTAYVKKGK